MKRPRADEDNTLYPTYFGIGTVNGVSAPDEEPEAPPAIWLPEHRSGSRFGGWKRKSLATQQRPIGFRKP